MTVRTLTTTVCYDVMKVATPKRSALFSAFMQVYGGAGLSISHFINEISQSLAQKSNDAEAVSRCNERKKSIVMQMRATSLVYGVEFPQLKLADIMSEIAPLSDGALAQYSFNSKI